MSREAGVGREAPGQTAADVALPFASCVVAALWIVPAALLCVEELLNPSWMGGLNYFVAGWLVLIGNAVSLPLHAVLWLRRGATPWFSSLVVCQSLVLLGCLAWWAM